MLSENDVYSFYLPASLTKPIFDFVDNFGYGHLILPVTDSILQLIPCIRYGEHLFEADISGVSLRDSPYDVNLQIYDEFLDVFQEDYELEDGEIEKIWQFSCDMARSFVEYELAKGDNLCEFLFDEMTNVVRIELKPNLLLLWVEK